MQARVLVDGACRAEALVLEERLSFWGGFDFTCGDIVDRHHPQVGQCAKGRVLIMPGTRGSSGGPGALGEAFRLGNGPSAILVGEPSLTIAIAVLVADEIYGQSIPVLELTAAQQGAFRTGDIVTIESGGRIRRDRPD